MDKVIAKHEEKIRRAFNKGCVDYGLLSDGDRILIGLSGGKDSLELVRLLGQRARIWRPKIEVEALHVVNESIPYEADREYLTEFCNDAGVKLNVIKTRITPQSKEQGQIGIDSSSTHSISEGNACFLCSWYRRKAIFEYATEHHFNKVALGHHQDDFIVTLLLNMTHQGSLSTMRPMMQFGHYPITLIRPLCLVQESTIREFATVAGFKQQRRACPFENNTRRKAMEDLFHQMEEINIEARYNLWHAINKDSI